MPVANDSAAANAATPLGSATSGNTTATLNVNPDATDLVAIAAILWTGTVDASGATFGVAFDGVAMTLLDSSLWGSNHNVLKVYTLDGPNTGTAKNVVASFSGMGTEVAVRNLILVVATYSGVDTIGSAVHATPSGTVNNSIAVSSVKAAHRVVTVHAVSGANVFDAYNQVVRAHRHTNGLLGGDLLLGDAPGAATVTGTATQLLSSSNWGAIGVPLTPAPVIIDAVLSIAGLTMHANANLLRVTDPAPERTWVIPAEPDDDALLVGNWITSSDGIRMPLWIKDPDDVLDYTLDWSNHILDGDPIVSASFSTGNSALPVFSSNYDGDLNTATVWLQAGVLSVTYSVVCRVTTEHGRQMDRTFAIQIGQN